MAAGFRESGISGVVDSKSRPTLPMVAVRSSGLALDSIIGFQYPASSTTGTQEIQPMVSEAYLQTLLQVANERFELNEQRKSRFRDAFLEQAVGMPLSALGVGRPGRHGYESKTVRKERKRREGLQRREEMLAYALDGTDERQCVQAADEEDEYGVSLLMEEDGFEAEEAESEQPHGHLNQDTYTD